MSNTIILCGPQGSGKTRDSAATASRLGCAAIVDEWFPGDPVVPGALHLTATPVLWVRAAHPGVTCIEWARLEVPAGETE